MQFESRVCSLLNRLSLTTQSIPGQTIAPANTGNTAKLARSLQNANYLYDEIQHLIIVFLFN